jgi:hypothetical protein
MSGTESTFSRVAFGNQDLRPACPVCGALMEETDRVTENGAVYIWYACPRPECDEQWLDMRPARAG